MADSPTTRLDLAELLMAVENAPPVAAADVLGERLATTLESRASSCACDTHRVLSLCGR